MINRLWINAAERRTEARGLGLSEFGGRGDRCGTLRQAGHGPRCRRRALIGPSSYFMKSPPQQFTDDEARDRTRRFIEGDV